MSTTNSLPYGVNDTAVRTTLSSGITSTDTSIGVGEVTNPPSVPFLIAVWVDQSPLREDDMEIMEVTSISGTTLTVNRGAKGTSAQSFSSGDKVFMGIVPSDVFDEVSGVPQGVKNTIESNTQTSLENLLRSKANAVEHNNTALGTDYAIFDIFADESKVFSTTDVSITDVANDSDADGKVEISSGGSNTPGTLASEAKNLYDTGFVYPPDEAYVTLDADIPADEDVNVSLADGYGNSVQATVGEFTDVSTLNSGIVRVDPLKLTSDDGNDTPTVRSYAVHVREGTGDWDDVLADFFPDESKITSKTDVNITTEGGETNGTCYLSNAPSGNVTSRTDDDSTTSTSVKTGLIVNPNSDISGVKAKISKNTTDTVSRAYLQKNSDGTTLDETDISGLSAGDPFQLRADMPSGVEYRVVIDDQGNTVDPLGRYSSASYPYTGTDLDIIKAISGGTELNSSAYAINDIEGIVKDKYVSSGTFDVPEKPLAYTPSAVQIEAARTVPTDESIELDLTDENGNTDTISANNFGSKQILSSITRTKITPTWRLKSSDGKDTPTLEEYDIRFYK